MDMLMIDVTDIDCKESNSVELLGSNIKVENVAKKHYHPFTSKNDIMEMIMSKMENVKDTEFLPLKETEILLVCPIKKTIRCR